MNKNDYLEELKNRLNELRISEDERDDIVNDYCGLYDDAVSHGYTDQEIYNKIGTPKDVVSELGGSFLSQFNPYSKNNRENPIVAAMPILSTILFLLLGFIWGLWHPGWLVFLAIPLTSILLNTRKTSKESMVAMSPLVSLIAFMILGYFGFWHPGWIVWLWIPFAAVIFGRKSFKSNLMNATAFICLAVFMTLGFAWNLWHPGWIVWLLIPLVGAVTRKYD